MSKPLVEISGFKELQQQLQRFPDKIKRREVLKILGQVATPTVRAARANAPMSKKTHIISGKRTRKVIQPGNLKKSIGKIRGKKGYAKKNAVLYVGPRSKGRKHDGWYGMFVESGTVNQEAQPFMKKAYEATKGQVTADSEKQIKRYIQRQIDKLSKL